MTKVEFVEDEIQTRQCFPVMNQLRPLLTEEEFMVRVARQREQGYQLYRLVEAGKVRAVAGFRMLESLGHGKFIYIDDLVSSEDARGKGFGGELYDWILGYARSEGCDELRLDCGVQRLDSHRFYMRKYMKITAHHFTLKLKG